MNVVVDANIFKGYYFAVVLGSAATHLTADPALLFARLGQDTVYLDGGGQIKHEWGEGIDTEWFEQWYRNRLQRGDLQLIPDVPTYPHLLKKLTQLGFPNTRDRWYVRVAKVVADLFGEGDLLTEDIDFYDPKSKKASADRRDDMIMHGRGKVAKQLQKEKIRMQCLYTYLEMIGSDNE